MVTFIQNNRDTQYLQIIIKINILEEFDVDDTIVDMFQQYLLAAGRDATFTFLSIV